MNVAQYSFEPLLRVAQAFPAAPRIMADLGRLLRNPDANLKDVTALLKRDSALAARLLRIANSAAVGQPEHVASIEDAAALIGFQEIHRLVGAVAIDQFSLSAFPLYGIPGPRLRENALCVALLMEELAGVAQQDPQAAYTTGLFRCIGKLALETLAASSKSMPGFSEGPDSDLIHWERHTFGITASEATAAILQQWHFPPGIAQAIARHLLPRGSNDRLAYLLNLAASMASTLGHGLPGEQRYWLGTEELYRETGVDADGCQRAADRAVTAFERLNRAVA